MIEFLLSNLFGCIVVFIAALALLIKSADIFTGNAEKLGRMLGIPQFIVGVTIVSIGTSLPELATSLIAVFQGSNEFVVSNVLGSNIANILLVVGLVSLITKKIKVEWNLIRTDLPMLLGSAILLSFIASDGIINFVEAILLFVGCITYVIYTIQSHKKISKTVQKDKFQPIVLLWLLISCIFIYFGAKFTIDSIIAATQLPLFISLGIDTSIIALSAVAIGTSLPELTVSFAAARRNNFEVALGNVIGSNIFNSYLVTSIPAFIATLTVSPATINLGIPVMLGATILFIISAMDKEVSRFEGAIFLLFYAYFIGKLFGFM